MQPLKCLLVAGFAFGCIASAACAEEKAPSKDAVLGLANQLKQSGNAQAATDVLRTRANAPDANADDFLALAASQKSMRAYGDAARTLQQAHDKFPSDTKLLYQLGLAYTDSGQPELAVGALDKLTAIEPDNAMAYNAKGVAFDKAGNHFAAQELYHMALKREPDAVPILNNLAMSLILDDRPGEAITLLEPLYEREEDNAKVRHNLALAYGLTGNKQKAQELGLKDLPEKDVQENLKFYEHYSATRKAHQPVALFDETNQQLVDHPQEQSAMPEPTPQAPAAEIKPMLDQPKPAAKELAPAAGIEEKTEEAVEPDAE